MNLDTSVLKLGDIVRSHTDQLRSGSSSYGAAVVACLDPFVLVSSTADMCWSSTVRPEQFYATGRASPEVLNAIQWRLQPEQQWRSPYGESFLSNELGCGLTLIQMGLEPLAADLNHKVKTWPCMGGWAAEIAQGDNPSYGWAFRYVAAEQLWKAVFKLDGLGLELAEHSHKVGQVSVLLPQTEHVYHFQTLRAETFQTPEAA